MKLTGATIVFDCDGVVLNSNRLKTDAFHASALGYGVAAADALVSYHVTNGGKSRWHKFQYFLNEIVGSGESEAEMAALLDSYARFVREGLATCAVADRLAELRAATADANWLIVSGGAQQELREVFAARGIADYFDGGIFGSPDTKDQILARELSSGNIRSPAVLLGDSRYDYEAAHRAGLDFIFVSGWSELPNHEAFVKDNKLPVVARLGDLLD